MVFPCARFTAALIVLLACRTGQAQTVDVTGRVQFTHADKQKAAHVRSSGVVIWLRPISGNPAGSATPGHFRLVQRDKSFHPHLLIVPVGSSVDFPNMDPFFHNVFSQFNGKRFDLGLYEEGSNKTVRFDHEGVSYIFCNIHPEMSAVIISLSTPFVSISSPDGKVELQDVPSGTYEVRVWAEGVDLKQLNALTHSVHIGPSQTDLGMIQVIENGANSTHKNKYGEDYFPDRQTTY
jgi:plastocyanin